MKRQSSQEAGSGPTQGYHVNVWGYVLELLVEAMLQSIETSGRLPDYLAAEYGKRSVWPATMMHKAFRYLVQQSLVVVSEDADGRMSVTVNLERLASRLRTERVLEICGQTPGRFRALGYWRARALYVRLPWLDRVLEEVHRDRGQFERSSDLPASPPTSSSAPHRALGAGEVAP